MAELARAVEVDDDGLSSPYPSTGTARAYANDWADFEAFCAQHGLDPGAGRTTADHRPSLYLAQKRFWIIPVEFGGR